MEREPTQDAVAERPVPPSAHPRAVPALLSLQRSAGNAAVARMVSAAGPVLQRKLTVNDESYSVDRAMNELIKRFTDVRHADAIEEALEELDRENPPDFDSLDALLKAAQAKLDAPEPKERSPRPSTATPLRPAPLGPDEDPFKDQARRQKEAERATQDLSAARGKRRDAKADLGDEPDRAPIFDEGVTADIVGNEVVLVVVAREPTPVSRTLRFSLARHHPDFLQRGGKQRNSVFHASVDENQVLADCRRFGARLKSSLESDRSATTFVAGGINGRTYKADIEGAGTSLNHFYVIGGKGVESLTEVETNAVLTLLGNQKSEYRGAWAKAPRLTIETMSKLTGKTPKELKPDAPSRR